jgi:putative ABC transport system permease protein
VVSHATSERTHEIGLRMALGAAPRDVIKLILKQGMTPVATGISIGIPAALVMARLASSLFFGVTSADALAIIGATVFLVAVAVGASFAPARRALQGDPMIALRHN